MRYDRDFDDGLDRQDLSFNSSDSRTLSRHDPPPSFSESPATVATVANGMGDITGHKRSEVNNGELGYKKKKPRTSALFGSPILLCPYLAIILHFARSPLVVRAQAQNGTAVNGTAATPPAPSAAPLQNTNSGGTAGTESTGTLPTIATGPTIATDPIVTPPVLPNPSINAPIQPPTQVVGTVGPANIDLIVPSVPPTGSPSPAPTSSFQPTEIPTTSPTGQPTFVEASIKETKFRQEFKVGNGREFNENEQFLFQGIYQQYTAEFAPVPATEIQEKQKITTTCTIDRQFFVAIENESERRLYYNTTRNNSTPSVLRWVRRRFQETPSVPNVKLNVDYTMKYESQFYNVTSYPKLFQNWTNSNLEVVLQSMNAILNVTEVGIAQRIRRLTPAPTQSAAPSYSPTNSPTITFAPSPSPSDPIEIPSTNSPTMPEPTSNRFNLIIVSVSLVIALSIIVVGIFIYYRKRRKGPDFEVNSNEKKQLPGTLEEKSGSNWAVGARVPPNGTSETQAYGSSFGRHTDMPSRLADAGASPNGSLVSSQSLISRGNSMGGDSREESDSAHILVDEFDQYKDQNLEKMRADIEDLPECDGMMSQAVAKALIDQDDESVISDSYWGGDRSVTAVEIEASALGFVWDWLKRNGKVSDREKREMMQEQLNKMTASVLHKVIGPDDATRTIHECAVLLGLKLASDLSVTTILISGLRKKATEADIRRTFSAFGDVAIAAVAPNEKGFGILRFKSNNAVNRAMGKFRSAEIVVEDVAVQLTVIRAGSNMGETEDNRSSIV